MRHIPTDLSVVWDRLGAHTSRATRQFVAEQGGRIILEYLPAYAPELNPVEYLWGHWKQHAIPNLCAADYNQLSWHARESLRRLRRRKTLIAAFWIQAQCSSHYIMQDSIGPNEAQARSKPDGIAPNRAPTGLGKLQPIPNVLPTCECSTVSDWCDT